jgi:hypothetical protein
MKRYTFRCDVCGWTTHQYTVAEIGGVIDYPCLHCGGPLRRIISSFGIKTSFQPHFNYSVGEYVQSDSHFRDALKRCAEEQYLQTGSSSDYTYVDGADISSMGVTDDGMEETARVQHNSSGGRDGTEGQ